MKVTYKIVYDSELEEYYVVYFEDGVRNYALTYHTESREDAEEFIAIRNEMMTGITQHTRIDQTGDGLNIPAIKSKGVEEC